MRVFAPCAQVDHIFSDKTGTLTQNIMKLRHWYIQGRIYDENDDGQLAQLAKVGGAKAAMTMAMGGAAVLIVAVDRACGARRRVIRRASARSRPRSSGSFWSLCVPYPCATRSSHPSTKRPAVRARAVGGTGRFSGECAG